MAKTRAQEIKENMARLSAEAKAKQAYNFKHDIVETDPADLYSKDYGKEKKKKKNPPSYDENWKYLGEGYGTAKARREKNRKRKGLGSK